MYVVSNSEKKMFFEIHKSPDNGQSFNTINFFTTYLGNTSIDYKTPHIIKKLYDGEESINEIDLLSDVDIKNHVEDMELLIFYIRVMFTNTYMDRTVNKSFLEIKTDISTKSTMEEKQCHSCQTKITPTWRYMSNDTNKKNAYCNKCGIYMSVTKKPKLIILFGKTKLNK